MRAEVTLRTAQVLVTVQSVAFELGYGVIGPEILVQQEYVVNDMIRGVWRRLCQSCAFRHTSQHCSSWE